MKGFLLLTCLAVGLHLVVCQIFFPQQGQPHLQTPVRRPRPRPRPRPIRPNQGGSAAVGGSNFHVPTDQRSPNTKTFTEGCQCRSARECPKDRGQLQHGCILGGRGETGICCLDQQGVSTTRFGGVNPNSVGAVSLPASTMAASFRVGQTGLRNIQDNNRRLQQQGNVVPRGSPAAGHAKFFVRNPSWIENNNFAYQLALATVDLAKRENLSPAQAQFGLGQTRTSPQAFQGESCPVTRPINCNPNAQFRTIDGSCNNLRFPRFGKSETQFSRVAPALYDDGIMSPRQQSIMKGPLPNVRLISSTVLTDKNIPSSDFTTNLMQFAQFMDHDLTHAPFPSLGDEGIQCCANGQIVPNQPPQCFTIEIPPNDGFYNRQNPPQRCINFVRSMFAIPRGCRFGPAEQLNALTHWIDGSMIYGSIEDEAFRVRDPRSPYLRVNSGVNPPLLPTNTSIDCEARVRNTPCFVAGDSRVNEQPALTMMHTVWVREHNRIVDQLRNSFRDPEELFQQARRIVIAELQHITYNEWLPLILGQSIHNRYRLGSNPSGFSNQYDDSVDPALSNVFATSAFRFGHSLVQGLIKTISSTGTESTRLLRDSFNNPRPIQQDPDLIDDLVRSVATQPSQTLDSEITRDLSNHLFQTISFKFGMDLMSLNIQRGRDHAIPTYNDMRASFGPGRARSFAELLGTHPITDVIALQKVYANVDDIDMFPGSMTETPRDGCLLGPTICNIVGDQFRKLKIADRFFYENPNQPLPFTPNQLAEIKKSSMSRIFCDNSKVTSIQPNSFVLPRGNNARVNCNSPRIPRVDLTPFAARHQG